MARKAVLVGCNYPGTKAELHGCINDVWRMHTALVERFGFDEQDITVLIDTDSQYTEPTGANIKKALNDMVVNSQSGDVLFFHYSGHGTRIPAETGEEDDTGYDECIVPCDMNLINDDDFRQLVDELPSGVTFTLVSDSCHSGGLIAATKEQIGDSVEPHGRVPEEDPQVFKEANRGYDGEEEGGGGGGWRGMLKTGLRKAWQSDTVRDAMGVGRHKHHGDDDDEGYGEAGYGGTDSKPVYVGADEVDVKNKALSLDTLLEILRERTGRQDIQVGSIRPTLYDMFGEDSSSKVKKFVQVMMGKIQGGGDGGEDGGSGFMGMVGSLATQFLQQKLNESDDSGAYAQAAMQTNVATPQAAYAGAKPGSRLADMGVLVSGCQSDQTSADARPGGNASQAYGALSNAIQTILTSSGPITNRRLVTESRRLLASQGFTQQPGLYCTDENVDAPFICHA